MSTGPRPAATNRPFRYVHPCTQYINVFMCIIVDKDRIVTFNLAHNILMCLCASHVAQTGMYIFFNGDVRNCSSKWDLAA